MLRKRERHGFFGWSIKAYIEKPTTELFFFSRIICSKTFELFILFFILIYSQWTDRKNGIVGSSVKVAIGKAFQNLFTVKLFHAVQREALSAD